MRLQPARRESRFTGGQPGNRPRSTDARRRYAMTKWQKCTMLAVLAAMAIAAPANAAEGDDAAEFTGETIAVESTAETQRDLQGPGGGPAAAGLQGRRPLLPRPRWRLRARRGRMAVRGRRRGRRRLERVLAARLGPALAATAGRIGGDQPGVLRRRAVSALPDLSRPARHEEGEGPGVGRLPRASRRTSARRRTSTPTRSTRGSSRSDSPSSPTHGLKQGGWRLVALRFEVVKAEDTADARVDDILVDPRMRY